MINADFITQAEKYLKRDIEISLEKDLLGHKVILLLGSRRVGKTSVLKRLTLHLVEKKNVNLSQIFYFDLENIADLSDIESVAENPLELKNLALAKGANTKNKIYIFIDEVQYLNSPSSLLKINYDHNDNIQIIASGSSTLQIKAKLKDSLVGRKHQYFLHPLTFAEFLIFKNRNDLLKTFTSRPGFAKKVPSLVSELKKYVEEFILFGGYPEIVLTKTPEEKSRELSEIYSDYVRKDIKDYLKIANLDKFNRLVKVLAVNSGNLINLQDLSNDLELSKPTIENYLFLLENTFTISRISPFFRNKRKELIEVNKFYFNDTGLRNFLINNFSVLDFRPDNGALFENAVFCQLYKNLGINEELHFWRTQAGAEVDFIKTSGLDLLPIEVKYGKISKTELFSPLKNFIENYHPKKGLVVTKSFTGSNKYKKTFLSYVPFYLFAFSKLEY